MKTQHTPAPWTINKVCPWTINHLLYDEPLDNKNVVCRMPDRNPETEANARLIAAAPQMLAALRAALKAMGDSYDATDAAGEAGAAVWDQVANAIETATGESADY